MTQDSRNKDKSLAPLTINEMHIKLHRDARGEADKYAKELKVSEERRGNVRLAALMEGSKWEDMEQVVEKNVKKMGFQAVILADLLKRARQPHRAERMMAYICGRDEDVYVILHRIDWVKKAIELAVENRNRAVVEMLVPTINDPELRAWGETKLDEVRRKK